MAHANNSALTGTLKGSIGKELVFRQWAGKTIVSKAPGVRKRPATPAQLQAQERFMLASRYAKAVIKGQDQGIRDAYTAALKPRQNLYCRATEDFLSAPVVQTIDISHHTGVSDGRIMIRAVDDFRVIAVQVQIYSASGRLLEKGNAEQQVNGIDWIYMAIQANSILTGSKIKAIATDVPGNEGTLELLL